VLQNTEVQIAVFRELGFIHLQNGAGEQLYAEIGHGKLKSRVQIAESDGAGGRGVEPTAMQANEKRSSQRAALSPLAETAGILFRYDFLS
jgi:hypothetical protein